MTTHRVRRKGARHVSWVASHESINEEYEIATLPDGTLACACMAYAFSKAKPKTCKHIGADAASSGLHGHQPSADGRAYVVRSGGEAFTVLRGIDLSDL